MEAFAEPGFSGFKPFMGEGPTLVNPREPSEEESAELFEKAM